MRPCLIDRKINLKQATEDIHQILFAKLIECRTVNTNEGYRHNLLHRKIAHSAPSLLAAGLYGRACTLSSTTLPSKPAFLSADSTSALGSRQQAGL